MHINVYIYIYIVNKHWELTNQNLGFSKLVIVDNG